jgi:Ras-related GTP-binding protein A/B
LYSKHTGIPAGSANFAELQIKASGFMFFITRLTDNTNLAVVLPPHEGMFNTARVNICLARPKFAELDVGMQKRVPAPPASAESSKHLIEEAAR